MKNTDLINALTNALGNPHFDPDKVQEQLKEQIDSQTNGTRHRNREKMIFEFFKSESESQFFKLNDSDLERVVETLKNEETSTFAPNMVDVIQNNVKIGEIYPVYNDYNGLTIPEISLPNGCEFWAASNSNRPVYVNGIGVETFIPKSPA